MNPPRIELIPLRAAVCSDAPQVLDVLVRITTPQPQPDTPRPAINLGLALDNSASMEGKKIEYARQAAIYTVDQLLPSDRVSVTTFNSAVLTIVPNMHATHKPQIARRIEQVQPANKTALHPGWKEGCRQVGRHLIADGINRVVLLSDGLANLGLTDPKAIAAEVRERAGQGVSTTTMGVGDEFNEDLMEAMARTGGGNYYYIESPGQLPTIFRAELEDMLGTIGSRVRLGIEPRHGATVARIVNDFEANEEGELMLPNLVAGKSLGVLVRFHVPPRARTAELCRVRLEWDEPGARRTLCATLALPAVRGSRWQALATETVVSEHLALLQAACAKKAAARALKHGDVARAKSLLAQSRLSASSIVPSPTLAQELDDIAEIEAHLERGDVAKVSKIAKYQSYSRLSASSIGHSSLAETEGDDREASVLTRSRLAASSIIPSPFCGDIEE